MRGRRASRGRRVERGTGDPWSTSNRCPQWPRIAGGIVSLITIGGAVSAWGVRLSENVSSMQGQPQIPLPPIQQVMDATVDIRSTLHDRHEDVSALRRSTTRVEGE